MAEKTKEENLIKALIKFQAEVPAIIKDKTNPFFKSKYSDLSSVINGVQETLTKCELAIIHRVAVENGRNLLITELLHSSGEMRTSCILIPEQNDPQKLGSLITYLRRYSYMALTGIASEDDDDDGNKSSKHPTDKTNVKQAVEPENNTNRSVSLASDKQKQYIRTLCNKFKCTHLQGVPLDDYLKSVNIADAREMINKLAKTVGEK